MYAANKSQDRSSSQIKSLCNQIFTNIYTLYFYNIILSFPSTWRKKSIISFQILSYTYLFVVDFERLFKKILKILWITFLMMTWRRPWMNEDDDLLPSTWRKMLIIYLQILSYIYLFVFDFERLFKKILKILWITFLMMVYLTNKWRWFAVLSQKLGSERQPR